MGGSKVDSAFHFSEVDEVTTRKYGELVVKTKLSPRSGYVALRQLKPIHKKGCKVFPLPSDKTYDEDMLAGYNE